MDKTFFMPEQVSTLAPEVDRIFYFIYWVSVFFFFLIVGLMVFFIIRYRRRNEKDTTPNITHSTALEIGWSVVPFFLIVVMFMWGFDHFINMRTPPHGAKEIYVNAQKWSWSFDYPEGFNATEMTVPVNTPIKLTMTSADVIHSFFVPSFRQKMDVLPNRYTTLWFEANKTGDYYIFCTEYCGDGHSEMLSMVHVVTPEEYEEWVDTGGVGDLSHLTLAERGAIMYKQRQCVTCHSLDGSTKLGPSFQGLFGSEEQLADGSTVTVDENYIRESITNPNAKIVSGFAPGMPSYQGQLTDEQITWLIEYIKSVK